MWKYAEVEAVLSKKQFIVETKHIQNFKNYSQSTKGKLYYVQQSGKSVKCLILKTANTMEDINNPRLRSRRPKINLSSLEEKSDDSDESMDLTTTKRKRKVKVQNEAHAKKITSQDILRIYEEQRSKGDDSSGEVIPDSDGEDGDSTHDEDDTVEGTIEHEHENNNNDVDHTTEQEDNDHEYDPIIRNEEGTSEDNIFSNTQVSTDSGHEGRNVVDQELQIHAIGGMIDKRNEQNNKLLLEEERQQRLKELKQKQSRQEQLEQDNREQEPQDLEEQKILEEEQHRLKELKRQKDQREREQRGRERQEHREREQRERECREHRERREQQERERREQREREHREQQQREHREQQQRDRMEREQERRNRLERDQRNRERPERRNLTDDEEEDVTNPVYIGGNIFIPSLAYTEAFREYRPAKFITIMSHAIWGYKNLALRAVKVMGRNRNKLPLTPAKKLY
ncbi:hypothetical protein G9C98_001770 [Cotesia typhae]|uniref:Uncharacterized protein n=1 Tax=Cotesia typhae TaxID=2053667 RepID=A0A8J5UTC4_9HYME|nr:hypothetical protein G9C98_001770 [Cotesia typhae]